MSGVSLKEDSDYAFPFEKDRDGFLALSQMGGAFLDYATQQLLRMYEAGSEVKYFMLRASLARGDTKQALVLLTDWSGRGLPETDVSKFDPGDHYHTLGRKFDTLQDALHHLEERHYRYGGLRVVRIRGLGQTGD